MKSWSLSLLVLLACSHKDTAKPLQDEARGKNAPHNAEGPTEPVSDQGSGDLGYGEDAKLFASAADAVAHILEHHPGKKPQVLGFGEFHKLNSSAAVRSALRRFGDDIIDLLSSRSSDLILESWSVDPSCGKTAKRVTQKVQKTIERPPETENEMERLGRKMKRYGIRAHLLQFKCEEYKALLKEGELDHDKLLGAITLKLGGSAELVIPQLSENKFAIVYGGSTHNDLFPYKGLESWSYAPDIAKSTEGGFIEIDLYVPEFVQGNELLMTEAWYPVLKEARADQVILIRRGPRSYIILMRKGLAE